MEIKSNEEKVFFLEIETLNSFLSEIEFNFEIP